MADAEKKYFIPNPRPRHKRFENMDLERKQKDFLSRQFLYVAHGTTSLVPPHEREGEDEFHVGTPAAARSRMFDNTVNGRPSYDHFYRISRDVVAPVRFGDNHPESTFSPEMSGLQPQLFESVKYDDKDAKDYQKFSGLVLPYRNNVEDRGSTSFIVPKSQIGKGVEYLGRWDSHRLATPEESNQLAEYYRTISRHREQ